MQSKDGGVLMSHIDVEWEQKYCAGGWKRNTLIGKSIAPNAKVEGSNPAPV